jgi:hypothetical protein
MLHTAGIREDRIRSLAMSLRKDQLSSDEFQRELAALTKAERGVLVEFLADLARGPVEANDRFDQTSRGSRGRSFGCGA